jgi:hypothetical protein
MARVIYLIPIIQCPLVDEKRNLKPNEQQCNIPNTRSLYLGKFTAPCHEQGACQPCHEMPDTAVEEIRGNDVRERRAMKLRITKEVYA